LVRLQGRTQLGGCVQVIVCHLRTVLKRALADRAVLWLGKLMLRWIARLFIIKTRLDACCIIYALALGAVLRGQLYQQTYPGFGGALLFAACLGAVFMAGAKLLEVTRPGKRGRGRRWTD
jgi:hypothetical protein